MKAVILCGGQGTRLREETEFRPKPMVQIGGRPILWHIMKHLAHFGVRDFVLCLGYRGTMIKQYFLDYEAMNSDFTICLGRNRTIDYHDGHPEQDYRVTLAETGEATMTGGRLKRVERYVAGEDFLLTYGDGVANVNIHALLEFHKAHECTGTITTVQPQSRFGMIDIGGNDRVTSFAEKPRSETWINIGFMVLTPKIFDYLDGDDCVLESAPLERLAAEQQLAAYRHGGFFQAMDTYREFQILNALWNSGNAPWKIWK